MPDRQCRLCLETVHWDAIPGSREKHEDLGTVSELCLRVDVVACVRILVQNGCSLHQCSPGIFAPSTASACCGNLVMFDRIYPFLFKSHMHIYLA